MGFDRGLMCPCLFMKLVDCYKVIIYMYYVDDYFFASSSMTVLKGAIKVFTDRVKCTPAVFNPPKGLGMAFEGDRVRRVIKILWHF